MVLWNIQYTLDFDINVIDLNQILLAKSIDYKLTKICIKGDWKVENIRIKYDAINDDYKFYIIVKDKLWTTYQFEHLCSSVHAVILTLNNSFITQTNTPTTNFHILISLLCFLFYAVSESILFAVKWFKTFW